MPTDLIDVLIQLPVVAAVIIAILLVRRDQEKSTAKNHKNWQSWLDNRDEKMQQFMEDLQRRREIENENIVRIVLQMQRQMEIITNVTILTHAMIDNIVNDTPIDEDIVDKARRQTPRWYTDEVDLNK